MGDGLMVCWSRLHSSVPLYSLNEKAEYKRGPPTAFKRGELTIFAYRLHTTMLSRLITDTPHIDMHTYCRKTELFESHNSQAPFFWMVKNIVGEISDAIVNGKFKLP